MNKNYLLHNEIARKLYFNYACNLPIIALNSNFTLSDKIYNNITEAFLINDSYKLNAMRECGIDEKYISGDASDYEKFNKFCSVLPKFAGHPLYLISHIELKNNFECDNELCDENCEAIWKHCNEFISSNNISEKSILTDKDHNLVQCIYIDEFIDSYLSMNRIERFEQLENAIASEIVKYNENGCKNAIISIFGSFVKPNLYSVNEILKRYLDDYDSLSYDDFTMLDVQILRTVGLICKKLSWTWLYRIYDPSDEMINYLEKCNALPNGKIIYEYDMSFKESEFEVDIINLAKETCLGNIICTFNFASPTSIYARSDYFRRVLCNSIGKWVENGEYTNDEKILKKLIEDILYNNLKETIV